MARQADGQLGDRDIEEVITVHLTHIMSEIKDLINQNITFEYTAGDIDEATFDVFLSVPQMWKAETLHTSKSTLLDF